MYSHRKCPSHQRLVEATAFSNMESMLLAEGEHQWAIKKQFAFLNISCISITSSSPMGWLKAVASENMRLMSVTLEVFSHVGWLT